MATATNNVRRNPERIIRADGCYVPIKLLTRSKVDKYLDQIFVFSTQPCNVCPKNEVFPESCEGCDNFQGRYVLWDVTENERYIRMPRDTYWRLNEYFGISNDYPVSDQRVAPKMPHADLLRFDYGKLHESQRKALTKLFAWYPHGLRGCLVAAPRTGKTVMSLAAAFKVGLRTAIFANQSDLLDNFRADAEKFTNLLEVERTVGRQLIGTPRTIEEVDKYAICLFTSQTFNYEGGIQFLKQIVAKFGFTITDEVHRANANLFSQLLDTFYAKHNIGVTATFDRKDGKQTVITEILGPPVATADADSMRPLVTLHYLKDVEKAGGSNYYYYQKSLQADAKRNKYILNLTCELVKQYRDAGQNYSVLIPVLYTNHVAQLYKALTKLGLRVGVFVGSSHKDLAGVDLNRKSVLAKAKAGGYDVVVGIRSIIGTGINCPNFASMLVICPTSNEYNMYQETKRVCTEEEGKPTPGIHYIVENCAKSKKYLTEIADKVFNQNNYYLREEDRELYDRFRVDGMRANTYSENEDVNASFGGFGGQRSSDAGSDKSRRTSKTSKDELARASYTPEGGTNYSY